MLRLGKSFHGITGRACCKDLDKLEVGVEGAMDSTESEGASSKGGEEGLECPVCWEGFDDGDNTPYVLWCGHSLCKSCVMSLQWAVVKFPGCPLQLPLFICCPWCQFLTFRLTWKGKLKYPCKNFFLLWVVESMKGESRRQSYKLEETRSSPVLHRPLRASPHGYALGEQRQNGSSARRNAMVRNRGGWAQFSGLLASFLQFTAKLPLVLLFLFIVVYVLPFSTIVLVLYCLVTVLFAVPSFLVVYFSYPSLDWLVREIVT